ncbi:MAG: hypothetical protein DHS20C15_07760 [Planctomycetota bacterium]|nr:MAG: hypothetical protein DHS20C15_07760 [Planctomycetota bacterium]
MKFPAFLRPAVLVCGVLSLLPATLAAQVRHEGRLAEGLTAPVPTYELAVPDVAALRAEDAFNRANGIGPLRYGTLVPLALPFTEAAEWQADVRGELMVARMRVHAPGAFSLGLEFDRFVLPEGGKLFVYGANKSEVLGAYVRSSRHPVTSEFVIEPYPGDTVVIEYSQPIGLEAKPDVQLRGLIYDYADLFGMESGLTPFAGDGGGAEGSCTHDVNCPEGAPYDNQKRATVRTINNGALCSASLINNTAQDGTKYLYTANHCGTNSNVVAYFNYQRSGCGSGGSSTGQNTFGAVLLANDLDTDGRLLRITGNIPASYQPYFNGWSRSTSSLSFGLSMHHPGGAPKNISIDNNGGGQGTSNFQGIGPVKVWNMNFHLGGTAGGSSGGPLFDQNNRTRGTLTGGPSDCAVSLYGRFHSFWNESNISQYLDPLGTDQTTLDGYDPFGDLSAANINNVTPNSGAAGGFTSVTISGTGLDGVSSVTFDGVEALSYLTSGTTQITAVSPGGTQGNTVDVAVTDGFGTDVQNNAFTFTANPTPNLSSVSPDEGSIGGGIVVTLSGPTLVGVTDVTFGGVSGTGLTIVDGNTVQVTVPSAAGSGVVDVQAIGNGSDTLVGGFEYINPGELIKFGTGHPGIAGLTPSLNGSGNPIPGDPTGVTLSTIQARPSTFGVTFASFASTPVPFKGGTLYAAPIIAQITTPSNFLGTVTLPGITFAPATPPGLEIYLQQAFQDVDASNGASLSNALLVRIGEP